MNTIELKYNKNNICTEILTIDHQVFYKCDEYLFQIIDEKLNFYGFCHENNNKNIDYNITNNFSNNYNNTDNNIINDNSNDNNDDNDNNHSTTFNHLNSNNIKYSTQIGSISRNTFQHDYDEITKNMKQKKTILYYLKMNRIPFHTRIFCETLAKDFNVLVIGWNLFNLRINNVYYIDLFSPNNLSNIHACSHIFSAVFIEDIRFFLHFARKDFSNVNGNISFVYYYENNPNLTFENIKLNDDGVNFTKNMMHCIDQIWFYSTDDEHYFMSKLYGDEYKNNNNDDKIRADGNENPTNSDNNEPNNEPNNESNNDNNKPNNESNNDNNCCNINNKIPKIVPSKYIISNIMFKNNDNLAQQFNINNGVLSDEFPPKIICYDHHVNDVIKFAKHNISTPRNKNEPKRNDKQNNKQQIKQHNPSEIIWFNNNVTENDLLKKSNKNIGIFPRNEINFLKCLQFANIFLTTELNTYTHFNIEMALKCNDIICVLPAYFQQYSNNKRCILFTDLNDLLNKKELIYVSVVHHQQKKFT